MFLFLFTVLIVNRGARPQVVIGRGQENEAQEGEEHIVVSVPRFVVLKRGKTQDREVPASKPRNGRGWVLPGNLSSAFS